MKSAEKIVQPRKEYGTVPEGGKMLQDIDGSPFTEKTMKWFMIAVYVLLVGFGVGTGYLLASPAAADDSTSGTVVTSGQKAAGVEDTSAFKDTAVGVIEKGGMKGEGTHQLIRDGGPSQTAYMISSVVDLDQFVGKKVKIWGETVAAKKVSWLMDVGRVELQE